MENNGGTQPGTAPPVNPDSSRPPVMDVVARKPDVQPGRPEIAPPKDVLEQIAPAEGPKPVYKEPIADMVKPPAPKDSPKEAPKDGDEPDKLIEDHKPAKDKDAKAEKPKKEAPPKPVKQAKHSNGVGVAIATTVFVMLILAGLAVYAYLQSN